MKKLPLLLFAVLAAASCASVGTSAVSEPEEMRATLERERMTKAGALLRYGEPNAVFTKDGKEIFEYKYVSVYNNPASYPFLIGLFFKANRYRTNYLYVAFDRDGSFVSADAVGVSGAYPPENVF